MTARCLYLISMLCCAPAMAQELPDMLGTWNFTVSGLESHPRCGASVQTGVLEVERKVTARAYRGRIRAEDSYEKCDGSQTSESLVTVRVKDAGSVTIDYDEEGWTMDRLRYKDGVMTGSREGGVTTRWEREQATADDGPTAEQIEALDAFLDKVRPDLTSAVAEQYREYLQKSLGKTGLNDDESLQVADLTVDRMVSCMLVEMRKDVVAREIPVEKVLANQDVTVIFNPQAMDMRANECIQDASWNAGVRIR